MKPSDTAETAHYFSQDELGGCGLSGKAALSATDYRTKHRSLSGQTDITAGTIIWIHYVVEEIRASRAASG